MDYSDKLDGVQEMIETAGRRVADCIKGSATPQGWGTQQFTYLVEAIGHLNRSGSLVRAVYGPETTVPTVRSPIIQSPDQSA